MIEDRYADEDFADEEAPEVIDERIAIVKAALAIQHQMVDKGSALRHVLNRAHDDAVAAVVNLIDVDPADAKAVRDLQWEIKRYDAMCSYIAEVLADGQEKADLLTAEQSDRLSELTENVLKAEQEAEIDD